MKKLLLNGVLGILLILVSISYSSVFSKSLLQSDDQSIWNGGPQDVSLTDNNQRDIEYDSATMIDQWEGGSFLNKDDQAASLEAKQTYGYDDGQYLSANNELVIFNTGGEDLPQKRLDGRELRDDGLWYFTETDLGDYSVEFNDSLRAVQGPDQYGYTWEDAYTYSWVDVSGGVDTGINNEVEYAGPVNIGFDFNYYSNTYTQLYISRNGYLSFNNLDLYRMSSYIPDPELPNDVIAPMWGPTETINYVRYQYDGVSPDRRMIIEWNQQTYDSGTEDYTYQAILHENGDIVFQYQSIISDNSWTCTSTGIEDSEGMDGLTIKDMCDRFSSMEAVRIFRPDPGARISLLPVDQSGFAKLDSPLEYLLTLENLGDLGPDIFEIDVVTDWAVDLLASDGITLLTDTNGNGTLDTGSLAVGELFELIVSINPPLEADIGDAQSTKIQAVSSLDPSVIKESTISIAYPTSFAQAYFDADQGAGVYLVHPKLQIESLPNFWTPSMGVVETANGNFVYASNRQRYDSVLDSWITDMHRTVFDSYGNVLRPSEALPSISFLDYDVWELSPALAASPNGDVGMLWYRYQIDNSTNQRLYNMYFSIINEVGEIVYGPGQLTNNSDMGECWVDENIPCYDRPQISATEDGKYTIAFEQTVTESTLSYNDVIYGIRNSDGTESIPLTNLTRGLSESTYYDNVTLSAINTNQIIIAWNNGVEIFYTVIDSSGIEVSLVKNIPEGLHLSDMVQLSDGKIVIVGNNFVESKREIQYLILESTGFEVVYPATLIMNPLNSGENVYVSVTKDDQARAVLTWKSSEEYDLYYALVDSTGTVITEPFVFRSSSTIFMDTSEIGYGNTTYSTEISPFTSCEAVTAIPVAECYALEALYNSTNGEGWTNASGWFELDNPGAWFGINVLNGHVSSINLPENNLSGPIPTELAQLSELQSLQVYDNYLTGEIPGSIGNLAQLKTLALSYNEFTGQIPVELGNLSGLEIINLSGNELTGSIPSSFSSLTQLRVLHLSSNQLSGSIPAFIGNMTYLTDLILVGNRFEGSIPVELGNLQNLESLQLSFNQLTGSIPSELGELSKLRILSLAVNGLTGTIPVSLANIPDLLILDLWVNQFSGPIPGELFNLQSLNWLDLGNNQLTGSIPEPTSTLENLISVNLSMNLLEGSLPSGLGLLTNLSQLRVNNNSLEGDIPESLTNLSNLCTPENTYYPCWGGYGLDLGYNGFNTTGLSTTLEEFLNIKDPDWKDTQFIPFTGCENVTSIPVPECEALESFYAQTNGDNWVNNDNWLVSGNPATWFGITVESGHVSRIYLPFNGLSGPIPAAIGAFTSLTELEMWGNQLTGPIPPELGNLTGLTFLDLQVNQLTGNIPSGLGNLINLEQLALGNNQLTGNIPVELGDLTKLYFLSLRDNQLIGPIPDEIGNLTLLSSLNLWGNQLEGSIPASFTQLTQLSYLRLMDNNLFGVFPDALTSLTNLRFLGLGSNDFDGEIPVSIGNLVNLTGLDLSDNNFEGNVPGEINFLTSLTYLDLGYNRLVVPSTEPPASFLAEKDPDWYLTQAVQETLSGDTGGTITSNDEATQIEVPPNVSSGDIVLLFEPEPSPDYDTGELSFAGNSFQLTAESPTGDPIETFDVPLVITLYYDDLLLGSITEDSLALYYWNEPTWDDVVNTCPDGEYIRNLDENWLSVGICHLSEFALLGEPNYPVFLPLIIH